MHGTDRIDPDRLGRYSSGNTEIRHLHLAVTRDNHILRFDVPVHNMLVMCRCQPLRYLDGNSNRFFNAQMTFLENVAFQRTADQALYDAGIDEGDRVWFDPESGQIEKAAESH